jgi:hypothetical protein
MTPWVVRVVLQRGGDLIPFGPDDKLMNTTFLECLSYAGILRIHRSDESGMCFDLACPDPQMDSRIWATANANRMQSYGYNAVPAPAFSKS